MPSYKASINFPGHSLPDAPAKPANSISFPVQPVTAKVSTYMDSSLPTIASGNDVYTRQFYNQGGLPQRRFLPLGNL